MAKKNEAKTEETVEMTLESLMAMGLTEEEAKTMLGVVDNGGSTGLPFDVLKINTKPKVATYGGFICDIEKEDGKITSVTDLGEKVEIILYGTKCQYSVFDETANGGNGAIVASTTIGSTFDAKKLVDLKTGATVAELKEKYGDKVKYKQIFVGLIKPVGADDSEFREFIWFAGGAVSASFNKIREGLENGGLVNYRFIVETKELTRGAVDYFVLDEDTAEVIKRPITEVAKTIKEGAVITKKFSDWVDSVNSKADTSNAVTSNSVTIDEDDDITFD